VKIHPLFGHYDGHRGVHHVGHHNVLLIVVGLVISNEIYLLLGLVDAGVTLIDVMIVLDR